MKRNLPLLYRIVIQLSTQDIWIHIGNPFSNGCLIHGRLSNVDSVNSKAVAINNIEEYSCIKLDFFSAKMLYRFKDNDTIVTHSNTDCNKNMSSAFHQTTRLQNRTTYNFQSNGKKPTNPSSLCSCVDVPSPSLRLSGPDILLDAETQLHIPLRHVQAPSTVSEPRGMYCASR
jgi:hypothetical protein